MSNKKVEKPNNWLLVKNLHFLILMKLGENNHFMTNFAWIWAQLDQNYNFFTFSQLFGFSTFLLLILYDGFPHFFGENYYGFSWSVRQPFALWLILCALPLQRWEPVTDSRCLVPSNECECIREVHLPQMNV